MNAVNDLSPVAGRKPACEALELPRATYYRNMENKNNPPAESSVRPAPLMALRIEERQTVMDVLSSERFQDKTPYKTYATLLDEGEVEVDESYFGAKRVKGKRGRGTYSKTPVFGILQGKGSLYGNRS